MVLGSFRVLPSSVGTADLRGTSRSRSLSLQLFCVLLPEGSLLRTDGDFKCFRREDYGVSDGRCRRTLNNVTSKSLVRLTLRNPYSH